VRHRYIAVEGPIGVGKSTFARHLAARIGADPINDTENVNPWLEAFYLDPVANALHAQLQFLVTRVAVLERIVVPPREDDGKAGGGARRRGGRPIVSDFIIDKDRLFAELTLDENEWRLYTALYERLVVGLAVPDLVVYLQAPVDRLIDRIERRGIGYEQRIDSTYLQRLSSSYERFFHDFQASPLLIVNTADIDLASDPQAIVRLVARIDALEGGRHYFNPG